jgi:hypothetical protein
MTRSFITFQNLDCADIIGQAKGPLANNESDTFKWEDRRLINKPVDIHDILSSSGS